MIGNDLAEAKNQAMSPLSGDSTKDYDTIAGILPSLYFNS